MSGPELFNSVKPRSSVDYLLRTQHQNSVVLVQVADQKANILIGLAAVVLTIILTRYKLDQIPVALAVFAMSLLVAAGVSLLTLLPRLGGRKPVPDTSYKRVLNFNSAASLSCEDYMKTMASILKSDDAVYFHQANELHEISRILYKKYHYLKISYLIVAAGILSTGFLLLISFDFPALLAEITSR